MIVGSGDIASVLKALPPRLGFIYFASGVSNSKETRESEFKREADLLRSQKKDSHLVYFSSLCIFYSQSRYAVHKKHMEELVRQKFKHYTIIRIGNITWGKNPHTIINFFKRARDKGNRLEIHNTYRYLVNKKEFLHWLALIPEWNCEMNITGQRMKIEQIVKKYVNK